VGVKHSPPHHAAVIPSVVIPVLVTGTHQAAISDGVRGTMGPGNKCRDDTEIVVVTGAPTRAKRGE
jgi:hypothetical protein